MKILGFSDASIAVVKRGMECAEQGLLADHIGMDVCPRIIRFVDGGYEMELLAPPPGRNSAYLLTVFGKLATGVWPRRSYQSRDRKERGDGGWLGPLLSWADRDAPWVLPIINRLYTEEPMDGYCLIHGDPALANLMIRNSGELVVTDPMPRMEYRKEIPNLKEVDMGKLIQSAMGWEHILGCSDGMVIEHHVVLPMIPPQLQAKALLWGAIHLARVAKRAPTKGRRQIGHWAEDCSRVLIKELG